MPDTTDAKASPPRTIVVAGDVMVDWNLIVDRDAAVATRSWREAGKVSRFKQPGGAWLLADLVKHLSVGTAFEGGVRAVAEPAGNESDIHQTYTVLAPASDDVWRVKQFLGVESVGDGNLRVVDNDPNAEIVVLLDSDLGFDQNEPAWPAAISNSGRTPWIIFKTSVPAFEGALWQRLVAQHGERLIVVMTVDDLRRKEIQLLRRLSWERAAQDLVWEMTTNPALRALDACRHVIVSFGTAGAMLFTRGEKPKLLFDPSSMEAEWEPPDQGSMIGYTSVLAAAVAYEIMIHPEWPQMADALPRGIAGMRELFNGGFGKEAKPEPPAARIAKATVDAGKVVSIASVSDSVPETWEILADRLAHAAAISPPHQAVTDEVLYELAARVAIFGPDTALADVPQLRIGKLFTVDRQEVESFRSVKGLLAEYIQRRPSKPFSIAVFGSPGSGKSFGVEEIATTVGGKQIKVLTFNLTQLARASDLHGAFHQIRDVSLRGQIPVVFWDEFDTTYERQPLGWLRYFIGPMQDGQFQEDQMTHPIGTSIFVFAGGTAHSKDEFVDPPLQPGEDQAKVAAERKALKVPDFISRLKGFLDVSGPNRRNKESDAHFLIRRAILLRSMIEKQCPDLFRGKGKNAVLQIDPGVLRAFLTTERYKHGARSLESVIAMSSLAGRKHFDSSSLPPEPQLALHVELPFERPSTDGLTFTQDVVHLEKLAAMAHEAFRRAKKGWTYHPVRDDDEHRHDLLVDYSRLKERDKEANRATVRWIPAKIAKVGYSIAPAGSGQGATMTAEEKEQLAKMEHEIWMKRKLAAGYVLGPKATESPKQSPYLVEWVDLPDDFKNVDREMIEEIPKILKEAGYILVKKS